MKVLNLYAGIGGNRKLWPKDAEITAVEIEPKIAEIYQKFFPGDKIVIADAHQYLLEHYKEFYFIWSSPPCPTHSGTNNFLNPQGIIRYPDMKLYEEIIFLKHFCECKWVVENVKSYYEPLIQPHEAGRHYFWSNFYIPDTPIKMQIGRMNGETQRRERSYKLDKLGVGGGGIRDDLLRNCVNPKLGLHVFNCAFKEKQNTLTLEEEHAHTGPSGLQ